MTALKGSMSFRVISSIQDVGPGQRRVGLDLPGNLATLLRPGTSPTGQTRCHPASGAPEQNDPLRPRSIPRFASAPETVRGGVATTRANNFSRTRLP